MKDYLKTASSAPLGSGKSCVRLLIVNIKNNGLMLGVCGEKTKNNISKAVFNDLNMISINSCGYVFNCGKMSSFNAKIQSGDAIKMIVSPTQG